MKSYRLQWRSYQRQLRQPLRTSQGTWQQRPGIILRLEDERGNYGWGEIAPLPHFAGETFPEALHFCQSLGEEINTEAIATIPDGLPACQFGFESAIADLHHPHPDLSHLHSCHLLSPEMTEWKGKETKTLKWKIGLADVAREQEQLQQLLRGIPAQVKIRLDANGGLDSDRARAWLAFCDRLGNVEFLEQPLARDRVEQMLQLSQEYATPLALDESVASIAQLETRYRQGWRGIFVVKPAIVGSPRRLRQVCRQYKLDTVFSSVFETFIGRKAALSLAAELMRSDRAVGFGTDHWFVEENEQQELTRLFSPQQFP